MDDVIFAHSLLGHTEALQRVTSFCCRTQANAPAASYSLHQGSRGRSLQSTVVLLLVQRVADECVCVCVCGWVGVSVREDISESRHLCVNKFSVHDGCGRGSVLLVSSSNVTVSRVFPDLWMSSCSTRVGWSDVTISMVTIRSPFCAYNTT